MTDLTKLDTRSGTIQFPAYIPVTTFGKRYPLDDLIRPYLSRLAPAVMISHYYAKQMTEHPGMPVLIDSGGFASLFKGALVRRERGLGILILPGEDGPEKLRPKDVLQFQEQHADLAFTLDFPVPPGMAMKEARKRQELTIQNAHWALENRRRKDMNLYACVQGWDAESARTCAKSYADSAFDGIAIGGLVPRARDTDALFGIVESVRNAVPDKRLHVFGIGKPELVAELFKRGVQSVDSSSYVRLAADGRLWSSPNLRLEDASTMERLHLALCNLAEATKFTLPLSASRMAFATHRLVSGPVQGNQARGQS